MTRAAWQPGQASPGDVPRCTGERVALAVIVLAGLLVRLYFFTGTIGNDDLRHAYDAHLLFPVGAEKQVLVNYDAIYRRMAVNLPLGLCMQVFGVHEWSLALTPLAFSLAGCVFLYLALRRLAGPAAGLAAAAVWAVLPTQVYQATLWLQDDVFTGTLAA